MGEGREELDMGKKPKEEIAVFGLGVVINKIDKTNEQLEKIAKALFHMENKVEALMDEDAQRRHDRIKRRF